MENKTKFIIYARKSTEDTNKQVQSIPDQVKIMSKLAKEQRLTVVDILTESGSAKQPNRRPEFSNMLKMVEEGMINGILAWDLSRISRNPTESGVIQQLLQDKRLLQIQTFNRTYFSEDNAIIFSVEAGMSNQYVRDLMKNVRRGMIN